MNLPQEVKDKIEAEIDSIMEDSMASCSRAELKETAYHFAEITLSCLPVSLEEEVKRLRDENGKLRKTLITVKVHMGPEGSPDELIYSFIDDALNS